MFLENLSCVKPAGTEVTPKASPLEGQTAKVGKRGRKHSGVLSVMTDLGPQPRPALACSGTGHQLLLWRRGHQNPPGIQVVQFPSDGLERWYSDVRAGFEIVQASCHLRSCLRVPCCPLLLLMPLSVTFSFGSPPAVAGIQTSLHWKVIEYPLVDIFGKYISAIYRSLES